MLACPTVWDKSGTSTDFGNVACSAKAANEYLSHWVSQGVPYCGTPRQDLRDKVSHTVGHLWDRGRNKPVDTHTHNP